MTWWEVVLCWLVGAAIGYSLGVLVRYLQRYRRTNARYVRPVCMHMGHKWTRLEGVPFQFCQRWRCDGARVAPFAVEQWPAEMVRDMELVIDAKGGALSQDRTP